MKKKIQVAILAGIVASAIMSLFMFIGSMIGMSKMSPPVMLAQMSGMPLLAGWVMHLGCQLSSL